MNRTILAWLMALEDRFPPRSGCHHGLCASKYGSEDTGFDDRLLLTMTRQGDDDMYPFFIEDGDIEKPQSEFIADLLSCWPSK